MRGLVKKKRASADTSNLQQQWNLEDLMFVCSLDEPENTTRYFFAHFKEQEKGLPKLMIGADGRILKTIQRKILQKVKSNMALGGQNLKKTLSNGKKTGLRHLQLNTKGS